MSAPDRLHSPDAVRLARAQRARERIRTSLPVVVGPVVLFVVMITAWQLGVWHRLFGFQEFTLPYPSRIGGALTGSLDTLVGALVTTLVPALLGYVLGAVLGMLGGLALSVSRPTVATRFGTALTAVQAMPILALAPLMSLWFGGGMAFKAAVVTIMTFPGMVSYAYKGLTNLEPEALELMAALNATRWQVLKELRIPGALPLVFTALRGAVVLALVGTVVSEVLHGRTGLGFLIVNALASFDTGEAWAALVALAFLGTTWYGLVALLERRAVPWR